VNTTESRPTLLLADDGVAFRSVLALKMNRTTARLSPMRWLALLLALAGCGERVPTYGGTPFPHDPAPPSLVGKIVTSNNGDDTLSLVDPAAPAETQPIPVGFNPIDIEGPHHLSVDPAGRFEQRFLGERGRARALLRISNRRYELTGQFVGQLDALLIEWCLRFPL